LLLFESVFLPQYNLASVLLWKLVPFELLFIDLLFHISHLHFLLYYVLNHLFLHNNFSGYFHFSYDFFFYEHRHLDDFLYSFGSSIDWPIDFGRKSWLFILIIPIAFHFIVHLEFTFLCRGNDLRSFDLHALLIYGNAIIFLQNVKAWWDVLIEDQFIIFLIDVYGNGYFHDQIFFDVDWYFFDDCLNLPYFILV